MPHTIVPADPSRRVDPNKVKVGDTVIAGGPGAMRDLPLVGSSLVEGREYTVTEITKFNCLVVDGGVLGWSPDRFSLPEPKVAPAPHDDPEVEKIAEFFERVVETGQPDTAILALSHDPAQVPTRGYDFNKGDRRFLDVAHAVEHAHRVFEETGVMQVMRIDTEVPHFQSTTYLIQAYGS